MKQNKQISKQTDKVNTDLSPLQANWDVMYIYREIACIQGNKYSGLKSECKILEISCC